MNLTGKFFGMALTLLAVSALVSCSNELNESKFHSDETAGGLKLVKTPEVYAWSGQQTLTNTYSVTANDRSETSYVSTPNKTRVDNNWEGYKRDEIPEDAQTITCTKVESETLTMESETEIISNYLEEGKNVLDEDGINHNFLFYAKEPLTFKMFVVYGESSLTHDVGIFFYDTDGVTLKRTPVLWDDFPGNLNEAGDYGPWYNPFAPVYDVGTKKYQGYQVTIPQGYKFGFYSSGQTFLEGYKDIYPDFLTTCYLLNPNAQRQDGQGFSQVFGVTFFDEDSQKTYIGYEDGYDFDFQDFVITCDQRLITVSADNTGFDEDDGDDPNPKPDPTPTEKDCPNAGKEGYDKDGCGHKHEDPSHCETCKPNEGCNKPSGSTDQGDTGTVVPDEIYRHDNEVEVNFEAVDSHENLGIEDLATKLSIHVRHATDVDIMIPVPGKYVIDSDDLYIFNEHYGVENRYHGTYGGTYIEDNLQELVYKFGDEEHQYEVKLYVEVVIDSKLDDPFDEGYIRVWTEGIEQEGLIDWCFEHNGDGINFEIWTYYSAKTANTVDHRRELKSYFDQSTIEFVDSDPDYYINAFGWDYDNGTWGQTHFDFINPDDCFVTPLESEPYEPKEDYQVGEKWDEHLNGTPYNYIWIKSEVTPDHAHGGQE